MSDIVERAKAAWTSPRESAASMANLVPELVAEVERLQAENYALRQMVEAGEIDIHMERGVGPREPLDWLPELEQLICGNSKQGHTPELRERRNYNTNVVIGDAWVCAQCEAFVGWKVLCCCTSDGTEPACPIHKPGMDISERDEQ